MPYRVHMLPLYLGLSSLDIFSYFSHLNSLLSLFLVCVLHLSIYEDMAIDADRWKLGRPILEAVNVMYGLFMIIYYNVHLKSMLQSYIPIIYIYIYIRIYANTIQEVFLCTILS